ncbi:MAG: hypothetical protein RMM58_01870 [Chloroflexota bacterium]|nr:hypothetical protein [Dehalococcoidia bacterium]MDW8252604.1 hypothetical protein [Chloroflexota bacterium]
MTVKLNALFTIFALTLALTGCAGPRSAPAAEIPACDGSPIPRYPNAPHQTWVIAFDRSTSYPVAVREAGQREAADLIDGLVRPGAGATIHILFIGRNSYDPENSLPAIVVPSVRPAAEPPPPPTPPGNRFDPRERKRYEEAVRAWCDGIRAEAERVERELAAAAEQVRVRTDGLRHHRVRHEDGSDFCSIVIRAEERFTNALDGSFRRLFWYSDMEPYGYQGCNLDRLPLLSGVEVIISHWYCPSAALCQRLRAAWNERFAAAGAASVRWYAVGEPLPKEEILAVPAAPIMTVAGSR